MPLKAMEDIAARICLVIIAAVVVTFPILACSETWIEKLSVLYTIKAGLWTVHMGHGVAGHVVKGGMTAVGSIFGQGDFMSRTFGFDKTMDLQEFQNFVCTLPQVPGVTLNMCAIWQNVLYASWGMLIGIGFGLSFMIAGAWLLYNYAFVKARKLARVWALALLIAGPMTLLLAETQYIIITCKAADMPPMIGSSSDTIGLSASLAAVLTLLSFVPALIFALLIGRTREEHRVEFARDLKASALEQAQGELFYSNDNFQYGSAGYSDTFAPPNVQAGYGGEMLQDGGYTSYSYGASSLSSSPPLPGAMGHQAYGGAGGGSYA